MVARLVLKDYRSTTSVIQMAWEYPKYVVYTLQEHWNTVYIVVILYGECEIRIIGKFGFLRLVNKE